mgnify:CR=1 FL=1
MAKKLKPLAGYCLIEPLDEQETTASGLALPEKAQEKPEKGKVIAVGAPIIHYEGGEIKDMRGYRQPEESSQVEKGHIVIFHKWAGQDVREGNKEYKLVKFSDLMGRYE